MGVRKAFKRATGKAGEKARDLFKKNPLAFSALPAPIKREAYERDQADAARAKQATAVTEARLRAAIEKRDGLSTQLADLRNSPRQDFVAFELTDAKRYRKYLR